MSDKQEPFAWTWEYRISATDHWVVKVGVNKPKEHPQFRNVRPLYLHQEEPFNPLNEDD